MLAFWTAGLMVLALTASPKEPAAAPEDAEERSVVVGVGVALELEPRAFKGGAATFVEYEALPGALELELGGQSVWGHAGRELSGDLIFKWPHRLAPSLEVMVGAGPTVVVAHGSSWGVEAAVDVMWWPTRRVGVGVEPVYDVLFRAGASSSFGVTAGPIVGW